MAKKSASAPKAAKKGAKKSSRKPKRSWNVYINRSLKSINKAVGISGKAMKIVNSFVNDVFVRVASEAANLARVNKKKTLGSREVQTGAPCRACEARHGRGNQGHRQGVRLECG